MLLSIATALGVCLACFYLLAKLYLFIYSHAVIFSRISFSLMAGLALVQNGFSVAENGTLNYFIAVAISLAVLFLISFLYRSDWAVKFGTSLLVSYIITFAIYGIFMGILGCFIDFDAEKEWCSGIGNYVIGIGCLLFAIKQTVDEMILFAENFLKIKESKWSAMFDRVLASFIYGCSASLYMGLTVYGGNIDNVFALVIPIVVVGVLTYVADIKLVDRFRKKAKEANE